MWLGLPFLVGLVPAVIAVAWVTRRLNPVLTTVGAVDAARMLERVSSWFPTTCWPI